MQSAVRPCRRLLLADTTLSGPSRARSVSVAARGAGQRRHLAYRTPSRIEGQFQREQCARLLVSSTSRRGRRTDTVLRYGEACGRRMASTGATVEVQDGTSAALYGPMQEYDNRVQSGRLRDDDFQRGMLDTYPCVYVQLSCCLRKASF